jgi:hypothetical protein
MFGGTRDTELIVKVPGCVMLPDGRVAKRLGQRHLALDRGERAFDLGRHDQPATAGQFAGHRTLVLRGNLDLDLHHRLEQHRLGLEEGLAEAVAGANLEGHVRAVDFVIRAVFEDRLDADDREFGDRSLEHRFAKTLLDRGNVFLRDASADHGLLELEDVG